MEKFVDAKLLDHCVALLEMELLNLGSSAGLIRKNLVALMGFVSHVLQTARIAPTAPPFSEFFRAGIRLYIKVSLVLKNSPQAFSEAASLWWRCGSGHEHCKCIERFLQDQDETVLNIVNFRAGEAAVIKSCLRALRKGGFVDIPAVVRENGRKTLKVRFHVTNMTTILIYTSYDRLSS